MWTVNSRELFDLRTPGGDRFTEFVDALVRAEAFTCRVSLSEISTTLRTNIRDGGVDTEIRVGLDGDSTGFMNVPTCWQYKATENRNVSHADLRTEINKPYAKQLIQAGYGYRFCICDDITPEKRNDWEQILKDEAVKINPSSPLPMVLTASHLATWASRFPALVTKFFRPLGELLHFQVWRQNIIRQTPKYVEVQEWSSVKQRIIEHINLSSTCNKVTLPIQGEAGVGKTRLTHETLASLQGIENLVLYTIDIKAIDIAYTLASDPSLKAILVADECLLRTRQQLEDLLTGHRDRIRVICIDNSGDRPISGAAEPWLSRIPEHVVAEILEQNFPMVPSDRRDAYVDLSGGFIRLAADLCNQDDRLVATGNISSALLSVKDYLRNRLNSDELKVINAIALFRRVGFRDDVKEDLDSLCETLDIKKGTVIDTANRLKDIPGFISFAGRYLYVTPELIARVAFENAWREYAENDPTNFLEKIPSNLIESFLQRVSRSASGEVRQIVGDFFRTWTSRLQPIDLTNTEVVNRFVILADTNPENYLPKLAQLISISSRDELLQIHGGYQGTRRSLVWLAERMARLPEFFNYSESILWHLALSESESNISNNATNVWQGFFQIFLSGTATPFVERIAILEQKLASVKATEINLAIGALNQAFNTEGLQVVGSPIVAGRIPPEQWQPTTNLEIRQCIDLALEILLKISKSGDLGLRNASMNVAIANMHTFLLNGYLEKIKQIFGTGNLPQDFLMLLIKKVEDILHYNSNAPQEVREWLSTLIPKNFHGRLIEIIGKSPWHHSFRDNQSVWYNEVKALAKLFCDNRELLASEIEWLCSPQAKSVWDLAIAMGEYDADARCLDLILDSAIQTSATGLAGQYLASLLTYHPQHNIVVNQWIDQIEEQSPKLACELFMSGGENTRSLERAFRLVDSHIIEPEYLGRFSRGTWQHPLSNEEFYGVLNRLVISLNKSKNDAVIKAIINLVYTRLINPIKQDQSDILEDRRIQETIWEFLEAISNNGVSETYEWGEILRFMIKVDADRVARIASFALVNEEVSLKDEAQVILVELAKLDPDLVVKHVGEVLLDRKYKWHFAIGRYPFLIQSLPFNAMRNWLCTVGVDGARQIARNLQIPFINENGTPVVPTLTEFVLSEFEEDEETFEKFCKGSHMQTFASDIASLKQKEADVARKFLSHSLRRVREWAEYEINSCEQDAQRWQQFEEERRIA